MNSKNYEYFYPSFELQKAQEKVEKENDDLIKKLRKSIDEQNRRIFYLMQARINNREIFKHQYFRNE